MTHIICRNVPQIKAHRHSTRKPRPFGAGLLRAIPSYRADHTASDEAWLIAEREAAEDRHYDAMADEAAFQDRYVRGICC